MSEFEIRLPIVRSSASYLDEISNKLKEYSDACVQQMHSLKLESSTSVKVENNLKNIVSQLNSEQMIVSELGKTLGKIVDSYEMSEKSVGKAEVATKAIAAKDVHSKVAQIQMPTTNIKNSVKDALKLFFKSFGNVGKVYGLIDSGLKATTWNQWASILLSSGKTGSKIIKDISRYKKIGRAIGAKNATANFLKKQFGLSKVGYASKAYSPKARFYNNLHNTTSPYNLKDAFAPLTGGKGVKSAVAAWAGVALSGITNAFSNIQEQKDSNGTMSTGRVVTETISETAIDTIVTYAGAAVVGAAITAITGTVAAPVVVAVATSAAIAGVNATFKHFTGVSATEFISDKILDVGTVAIKGTGKIIASWSSKLLSFA